MNTYEPEDDAPAQKVQSPAKKARAEEKEEKLGNESSGSQSPRRSPRKHAATPAPSAPAKVEKKEPAAPALETKTPVALLSANPTKVAADAASTWEAVAKETETLEIHPDTDKVTSVPALPPLKDNALYIYWIDMHEEPTHPGTVYIFGKVWNEAKKVYSSCTVAVTDIERTLYVAPRKTAAKNFEDLIEKDQEVHSLILSPDSFHVI